MANKKVTKKDLDDALKSLSKNFGSGYAEVGLAEADYKAFPTGYDDLDALLTKGSHGVFCGGVVELMGSEGSGKTSVAMRTVGYAQAAGHRCCWIDAEASFSPDLAILNGCKPEELIMPDLANTEAVKNTQNSFFNSAQILEMVYQSVASNIFGLVVVDSVAGLIPDRVLQPDFDANSMGMAEVARNMATILPKIAHACKEYETTAILINQLRDKPGDMFPDRFHTPGGRALKFFASQRISIEKIKSKEGRVTHVNEDGKEEIIGHYARATVVKNKKAPPVPDGVQIHIPIYYREYFPDDAKKCYDLARSLQVITIRQGTLTWKDGEDVFLKLDGEATMLEKIRNQGYAPYLAKCCVEAAKSEKNQKRKVPIRVPVSLAELSKSYDPKKNENLQLNIEDEVSKKV